jgi:hypothetical protein
VTVLDFYQEHDCHPKDVVDDNQYHRNCVVDDFERIIKVLAETGIGS